MRIIVLFAVLICCFFGMSINVFAESVELLNSTNKNFGVFYQSGKGMYGPSFDKIGDIPSGMSKSFFFPAGSTVLIGDLADGTYQYIAYRNSRMEIAPGKGWRYVDLKRMDWLGKKRW